MPPNRDPHAELAAKALRGEVRIGISNEVAVQFFMYWDRSQIRALIGGPVPAGMLCIVGLLHWLQIGVLAGSLVACAFVLHWWSLLVIPVQFVLTAWTLAPVRTVSGWLTVVLSIAACICLGLLHARGASAVVWLILAPLPGWIAGGLYAAARAGLRTLAMEHEPLFNHLETIGALRVRDSAAEPTVAAQTGSGAAWELRIEENARHLPAIEQAVRDIQLGIASRLLKRYLTRGIGGDANRLAHCVACDLLLDDEGMQSMHDFAVSHAAVIANEVEEAANDTEIREALGIAYAAQTMAVWWPTSAGMRGSTRDASEESDRILSKASALDVRIMNIVSLWGKETIVNLASFAKEFREAGH